MFTQIAHSLFRTLAIILHHQGGQQRGVQAIDRIDAGQISSNENEITETRQ